MSHITVCVSNLMSIHSLLYDNIDYDTVESNTPYCQHRLNYTDWVDLENSTCSIIFYYFLTRFYYFTFIFPKIGVVRTKEFLNQKYI